MSYKEKFNRWINSDFVSAEEKAQLRAMSDKEAFEAFYKNAEFGTAGMRGVMGLGTNRLNIHTIRMASKGFAEYLLKEEWKGTNPSAVVAYDTRNNSEAFALETAKVLAAAGIKTYLFDRYSPVPLLSFAVRYLNCDGGVVITASHNTSEYNGFKVYDNTGCQMSTEPAAQIAANMEALEDPLNIAAAPENDANIVRIGDDVIHAFLDAIKSCGDIAEDGYDPKAAAEDISIVYTSIHGSGRDYVMAALQNAGFNVRLTENQAEFNGDFPTVSKPNPEDSAALRYAAKIALEEGADMIIGTDPDCDRIGVGVVRNGEIRYLTGNQTGALLVDYLKAKKGGKLITTIVTSELGPIVAREKGLDVELTLTGFKYIGGIMNELKAAGKEDEFFMGYEESYGYLTGTHARDKDGVSAALTICKMAAYWKAKGKTLADVLDSIYDKFGYWFDTQQSFVYEGSEGEGVMKKIMANLREAGAEVFADLKDEKVKEIRFVDYQDGQGNLPKANVLQYRFADSSWIAVRPSGTEPKIKVYYCMRGKDKDASVARQQAAAKCIGKVTAV